MLCGRLLPSGRVERPLKSLGETEVEELDSRLREHHVAGLQVAMHDPAPVRLVQRVGDLPADTKRLFEGELAPGQTVGECLAFQELHDEVLGLALTSHVVERADVRVRQLRDRLRLTLQTLARLGRRGQPRGQDLDRDLAAEPRVFGAVDLAHSARAERREDLVRAETGAVSQRHGFGRLPNSLGEDPLTTSPLLSTVREADR